MEDGAFMQSWLRELDIGQWRSESALWRRQEKALGALLEHAGRTVPFYANRLSRIGSESGIDRDRWAELPILQRNEVVDAGADLHSTAIPPDHGRILSGNTSGSSGSPLHYIITRRATLVREAVLHRNLLWHQFDLTQKAAFILTFPKHPAPYPEGRRFEHWTPLTQAFGIRGELACLDVTTPIDQQVVWLRRERPRYLHTFPSNAAALAEALADDPVAGIEKLYLVGETVTDQIRDRCEAVFAAPVVDRYAASESGQIAVQCPSGRHYHVHGETVLVEVIRPDGRPAAPGEIGQVVVTNLVNYAMPLIRYQLDDYVEVGDRCDCGRGLPVINRILGRQRNMFRFPDGSQVWPSIGNRMVDLLQPQKWQVAQVAPLELEVRYQPRDGGFEPDYDALTDHIRAVFRQDLSVRYRPVERLQPLAGGKFYDYVCEL